MDEEASPMDDMLTDQDQDQEDEDSDSEDEDVRPAYMVVPDRKLQTENGLLRLQTIQEMEEENVARGPDASSGGLQPPSSRILKRQNAGIQVDQSSKRRKTSKN